jgi:hypothetical protein
VTAQPVIFAVGFEVRFIHLVGRHHHDCIDGVLDVYGAKCRQQMHRPLHVRSERARGIPNSITNERLRGKMQHD